MMILNQLVEVEWVQTMQLQLLYLINNHESIHQAEGTTPVTIDITTTTTVEEIEAIEKKNIIE